MKKTNVNSEVKYETINNNLKTTDPQVEYQVNDAENGLFVGDKAKWPKFILLDEHLDRAAKNNFVIGEIGKSRAYHLDLREVEQFSNQHNGDKTTDPKVDYHVESHIPCDQCETNLNRDSLNTATKKIEVADNIFVHLCLPCYREWESCNTTCPKCKSRNDVIGMNSDKPMDFSNPILIKNNSNKNHDFLYCKKCDVAFEN